MKVCSIDYIRLKLVHGDCVLDDGDAKDCTFADGITGKEQCKYWVDEKTVPLNDDADYCQCCGQSLKVDEK